MCCVDLRALAATCDFLAYPIVANVTSKLWEMADLVKVLMGGGTMKRWKLSELVSMARAPDLLMLALMRHHIGIAGQNLSRKE